MKKQNTTLVEVCPNVLVVSHKEDTSNLVATLQAEGFSVTEVRGPYPAESSDWSPSTRCLVNHTNAWRIASERTSLTVIVEADFVPVIGFGKLPFPSPKHDLHNGPYALR